MPIKNLAKARGIRPQSPGCQSSEQHDTYELRETWHTTAQPGESKVDGTAVSELELIALDTYGEVPPATRDEMFAIMRDRLEDIDDLLLQDESPREMWAAITDEKVMRRALVRELRTSRNHMYTVDQKQRLPMKRKQISAFGPHDQISKIGEKPRTAKDLRATITDQRKAQSR